MREDPCGTRATKRSSGDLTHRAADEPRPVKRTKFTLAAEPSVRSGPRVRRLESLRSAVLRARQAFPPFRAGPQSVSESASGPRVRPLTDFDHVWKELGLLSEPWLGRTLRRDYALQFARKPPPFRVFRSRSGLTQGDLALRVEVSPLLHRGAVAAVSAEDAHKVLYSRIFWSQRKAEVRAHSRSSPAQRAHCYSLVSYAQTKQLLERGAVRILSLPFGYTLAQRTFSKCAEAALEHLRRQGIRILTYIDDYLILAASRQGRGGAHGVSAEAHFSVGFVVNREKKRSFALTQMGQRVLGSPLVPARQIMSLLGMMAAAHPVVRLDSVRPWDKGKMVCASTAARVDIQYWFTPGLLSRGVPLGCVPFHTEVFTDASLTGWGGVLGQSSVGGVWSGPRCHINLLEMEAVRRVLLHFSDQLEGAHVRVRSDNSTVVSYLNRQGGVRSPRLHNLTMEILLWATSHLASLRARYVPGVLNVGADRRSRGGPPRDEWGLAPDVAREVWSRFGRPVADLFASAENAQCPLWFSLRSTASLPWGGRSGPQTVARRSAVCLSPSTPHVTTVAEDPAGGLSVVVIAPNSPNARWFPSLVELAVQGPWALPNRLGTLVQAGGHCARGPYWATGSWFGG
ncbi:hypothetical protein WMY93_005462 [Mugilogobius chulae]|uniref:Reverse transcriptase domain-containing protein n=1 Tax=Mugilogobius chulae TaxID=88201 RepID=A0AAW0PJV6_9GOBI